jgi:hypothetical protein
MTMKPNETHHFDHTITKHGCSVVIINCSKKYVVMNDHDCPP